MPKLRKSFTIPRAFRDGHLRSTAGQVPSRTLDVDRRALDRMVSQKPPPWSVERLLDRPVFTTRGAVEDLGLDPAVESEWARYLQAAISSPEEFQMRQQVMERLVREDWDPERKKTLFQRAISLYRNSMKKAIQVYTPDELLKAQAEAKPKPKTQRGGEFYRRVPKESGGYRYYYTPDKYHARGDAHESGEDVKRKAMGSNLGKMLDKAGDQGCALKDMKELVKKYGSKEVASHFQKECGENGSAMFANGRFYRRKK